MFRQLRNTVAMAHEYLGSTLGPGGVGVDATVGNGNDTLFMARLVGSDGRVYGFDIQEKAIQATVDLIAKNGYMDVVRLFHTGHENMGDCVTEPVDAVVFNLGYLPGGDHGIVTAPASTVQGVRQGLALLRPGGLMCIVVYTGHSGGEEERQAVEGFLQKLDKKEYCVGKLDFLNRERAPYLIVIEKSL